GDAPAAALVEQARALGGGMEPDDAAVAVVGVAAYQAVALHADDQAGDGRGGGLFGTGPGAERDRPAEHHARQRRGARRGQADRFVVAAEAAQEVDRRRVEAVGDAAVDV